MQRNIDHNKYILIVDKFVMIKGDTPKVLSDDSLKIEVKPHPFSFNISRDKQLNEHIAKAINLMGGTGDNAEANYQSALADLTSKSQEVVSILASEYKNLPKNQYLDRWSLVQLLVDLKDPSSLPILDEILSSQIPSEESKDPHSFSTVREEVIIRTTAVEALIQIAVDRNTQALELLLKHVQHENSSVKRASIQGYLAYGGTEAHETLLRVLPKKDHLILNIHRKDVREVPQAEGGMYLAPRKTPETYELPPAQLPNKKDKNITISMNRDSVNAPINHKSDEEKVDNG